MEDNIKNTEDQYTNNALNPEETESMQDCETEQEEQEEKPKKSGIFSKKDKKNGSIEDLKVANLTLQAEKAEIHDKFLRLYSEFDNYRKRTQKEKIDIIKNASECLIIDLLPIIDDMEKAICFNENADINDESIQEGLVLILQKMKTMLKQKGLEEISTKDGIFNTDFHEAITTVETDNEEEKGKILDEIQKGYTLNNKVIRFSKVVISQ